LSLTSLRKEPNEYYQKIAERQADFINCIVNSQNERVTYDLRIISRPDSSSNSNGRINIFLLSRLEGVDQRQAERFSHDTRNLLQSQFPEYSFQPVASSGVRSILQPFPCRQLVALTRRVSFERLDTLTSGRQPAPAGFMGGPDESGQCTSNPDELYHLFPFLPESTGFEVLFQYLLASPGPVCISVRLGPTALTATEEQYLEQQIATCERYAQVVLGNAPADLSGMRPTLRHQAELLQQYQQRMLFGLKDSAALMTIELASPDIISPLLLDLLGSLITGPAGGARGGSGEPVQLYFAGGYDVHDLSASTEHKKAFKAALVCPREQSDVPPGAERLVHLFDSLEAAAAFRLPPAGQDDLPGVHIRFWRSLPLPHQAPTGGCFLGINSHHGGEVPAYMLREDRRRHVYVIGQTGTGKTTLLRSMILDDIEAGQGVCVVDPHGDLFADLLGRIPEARLADVVLLDPTDAEYPVGLNLLECDSESERYFVAQELVGIFSRLLEDEYGSAAVHYAGPVFFQHMRMNLLLLMSKPELPGTFVDFYSMFQSKDYWKKWTPVVSNDPVLKRWVEQVLPKTDYLRQPDDGSNSMGSYLGSKFENLVFDPRLRNIFGQRHSTINFKEIIDGGKILLVNLAKGALTEQNSRFLGMVLLAKLIATALERVNRPESDRRLFNLYVDEFQSFATQGFITLLSEARKFGVSLVLANQFLSQVANSRIIDSVFGNVGTVISFRLGHADAGLIEPQFLPELGRSDLVKLPNWEAYVKTLVRGDTVAPFSIRTTVAVRPFSDEMRNRVRKHSRATWSNSRAGVEKAL
jgi:hypothetical protein